MGQGFHDGRLWHFCCHGAQEVASCVGWYGDRSAVFYECGWTWCCQSFGKGHSPSPRLLCQRAASAALGLHDIKTDGRHVYYFLLMEAQRSYMYCTVSLENSVRKGRCIRTLIPLQ